jgi:RNA polymerase sigma-70 factor (ECF subfamily)
MPPLTEPTDQELMVRVQLGDLAALDSIFTRHHSRIFGYLSRWLDDPSAAEDIVQETFLRVLRQSDKAPAHDDLLPWLLKIARNLVIDRYRRERGDLVADEFEQICDPGPIPLEQLTAVENEQRLAEALTGIAAPHREILLLRAVDDLDYRDIALLLGCTEGAARVRAHRATAALRTAWYSKNGRHHD